MRQTVSSLACIAFLASAAPAFAQEAKKKEPLGPIEIGDGVTLDPILDVRLRAETADQETFAEDALSVTVRARAGARVSPPKWAGSASSMKMRVSSATSFGARTSRPLTLRV